MRKSMKGVRWVAAVSFTAVLLLCADAQTSRISYQGYLRDGGVPANGQYDFQFVLFPGGTVIAVNDLLVTNGLFTTDLDYGAAVWNGADREIEVRVRPGDSVGLYTTLTPRAPIRSAPYAIRALNANTATTASGLTLPFSGSLGAVGALIAVTNTNTTGLAYGLFGRTDSSSGLGVYGYASASTGTNNGVAGISDSASGRGVFGQASSTTGTNMGVYGISNSTAGRGVFGQATATEGVNYGVQGSSSSTAGRGVYGLASANSGANVGVYGATNSTDGYGGYFPDRVYAFQLGVGTTLPEVKLHVSGGSDTSLGGGGFLQLGPTTGANLSIDTNEIMARNNGAASLLALNAEGGNVTLIQGGTGTVAIGTASPASSKLHIFYNSATSSPHIWLEENGADYARINFTNTTSSRFWAVAGIVSGTSTTERLNFFHSVTGDIMSVRGDGRVGIMTTNPATTLHVNGTARVDVLEIVGADLAEKFPVSEETEPGMVMEIDPNHPGQLRLARGAYNRRVAGIVSGANDLSVGVVLGHRPESEGGAAIAMSGRVWVYCDASERAVQPGDMLTTSNKPGLAMAVRDMKKAQGAIIGKAMTSLEKGKTGLVLVLVNLQ